VFRLYNQQHSKNDRNAGTQLRFSVRVIAVALRNSVLFPNVTVNSRFPGDRNFASVTVTTPIVSKSGATSDPANTVSNVLGSAIGVPMKWHWSKRQTPCLRNNGSPYSRAMPSQLVLGESLEVNVNFLCCRVPPLPHF
jgi:hypothetical protein